MAKKDKPTVPSRLQVAQAAAVAAGSLLRRQSLRPRTVRSKGLRDLVTDADLAAQALILEQVRAAYPADALLSEEGPLGADLSAAGPTWIIDPLDGTSNYARQLPLFAVSIGVAEAGVPVLGVVYDPLRQELFYAERGQGAWVRAGRGRPRPITVSATAHWGDAVLSAGWPREDNLRARAADLTPRLAAHCHSLRLPGSAALTLAYIAAGRLDGYYTLMLQPWDVAGGAALILEAGGRLSALDGGPWRLETEQVVASNGRVHAEMVERLNRG